MTEIVTEARAPNSAVRGHGFPALESGNISFPAGRYRVFFEAGADECSFRVRHQIEGAPLIASAVAEGLARFVCTVASPVSSYRVSHVADADEHTVVWKDGDLGEPPMFTPMVVVATPFDRVLDRGRDGVHELWHGRHVKFETGTRLALSDVVLMRSSALNMLVFHEAPSLGAGEFRVEAEPREGFRFRIELAPDLHSFLKYNAGDKGREHIVTHILSACFGLLKSEYSEDDEEGGWRTFRGLRAIADLLDAHGLPHWSEGEEFAPELAATRLRPHRLGESLGNGVDEE